ncbi:hypothetical protein KQI65_02020 [bacterium]|nr:hypothetical protein [bacterium]
MRKVFGLTTLLVLLLTGMSTAQTRVLIDRDTARVSPVRDSTRVPPWIFPSATLDNSSLRIWNEDTLLNDLQVLSVFVGGEEFIASHNDIEHYSGGTIFSRTEGNAIIGEHIVKPVFDIPLTAFYRISGQGEKKYLSIYSRPDSLYMAGAVKSGDWFFQRLYLGTRNAYDPGPWYYQKRSGGVWCNPPGHAPPWKFFQEKSADL